MNGEILKPEISFVKVDQKAILLSNERVLETDDLSPEALTDFVSDHHLLLLEQLDTMRAEAQERSLLPVRLSPIIYMARLGLLKDSKDIFTQNARYEKRPRFETSATHLQADYIPYWTSVKQRRFLPYIGTVMLPGDPSVLPEHTYNGIWLGLTHHQN